MRNLFFEHFGKMIVMNHLRYTDFEWQQIVPQTHEVYEIIYVKQGSLVYHTEGKNYDVANDHMIIVKPGLRHSISFVDNSVYERYDLFVSEKIGFPNEFCELIEGIEVIDLSQHKEILCLLERMDKFHTHFSGDDLDRIVCDVARQIVYELQIILKESNIVAITADFTVNKTVEAALKYIDDNISFDISIESICKELYISKGYLHRLFSAHLQTSVGKYICAKRLTLAQEALRSGAAATKIFSDYGFGDYSSFFRSYKKHFGYPPSKDPEHKIIENIEF